uniref:Uncharacterized protein n=1 Tax=Panagrolaimus davidi TaxID=227884 RepID=A0A914R1K0_9BILA
MVAIASGTAYMAINLGPTVEEEVTVYSNRCLVNSIKRKICDCEAVNEMEKNVPEDMLAYRLHLEYSVLAGVYGPNIHPKEKVLQDAKPVLSASPQNGPNNLKMSSSKDGKRLSSLREEDSNISEEKKCM